MSKLNRQNSFSLENIIFNKNKGIIINDEELINNFNWKVLWQRKIDNIENQMHHLQNKYLIIEESIDYYIGMTESAILYMNTLNFNNSKKKEKVLSYIRINDNNIGSIQNLTFDYASRNISEYLKCLFINEKYDFDNIRSIFDTLNFDEFLWSLVYARMYFPNFYFDTYDRVISGIIDETELLKILDRVDEYENFLEEIYVLICEQKKIPKITWY